MKYYELYQRLDYGYMKTAAGVQIYLRSTLSVLLPNGVTLMGITSGSSPKWTIDYYFSIDNLLEGDNLYEKIELLFLKSIALPAATDAASLEKAVRTEVTSLIDKIPSPKVFTVVSNIYNDKKVLEGQVTNTISNDGKIIAI
jgi:hypothetical protein